MDFPQETDCYSKESIQHSLEFPIFTENLCQKLLTSEDFRRRLQDRIFALDEEIRNATRRLEQYMFWFLPCFGLKVLPFAIQAEASMSAQGLRKCIKDKEMIGMRCRCSASECGKFERKCLLYDRDVEKLMASCDELGNANEELNGKLKDSANAHALVAEVEALKSEKEHLRVNLVRAEEEAKVLFEENNVLDQENKWLLGQLNKVKREGSDGKLAHRTPSVSGSNKGKRKAFPRSSSPETELDFDDEESTRQPLSPLKSNSPDSVTHGKTPPTCY